MKLFPNHILHYFFINITLILAWPYNVPQTLDILTIHWGSPTVGLACLWSQCFSSSSSPTPVPPLLVLKSLNEHYISCLFHYSTKTNALPRTGIHTRGDWQWMGNPLRPQILLGKGVRGVTFFIHKEDITKKSVILYVFTEHLLDAPKYPIIACWVVNHCIKIIVLNCLLNCQEDYCLNFNFKNLR